MFNFDSLDRYHLRQDLIREQLKSDPCMKIPKPGDTLILNSFVMCRGNESRIIEATCLAVADSGVKVSFESSGSNVEVEWVAPWVVLDVIEKVEQEKE